MPLRFNLIIIIWKFCGNEPNVLLAAAKLVEEHCDAVDINLGCPQDIARRGKYGAFLQEDWDLIYKLSARYSNRCIDLFLSLSNSQYSAS